MTPTSLVIVADRRTLKAYRVDETPTRGPSLHLVQAFNITDAHGKLVDKVTDLAGRYSGGTVQGFSTGRPLRKAKSKRKWTAGFTSSWPIKL